MESFLLRMVFVISVVSVSKSSGREENYGCFRKQEEMKKVFGPGVAQYYWYPKCSTGDYWETVQCDSRGCYCAYIDTGRRIPNSLSHVLIQYMQSNCPVESAKPVDPCSPPTKYYPCKKKTKKYYYNSGSDSCEASEESCLGFETSKLCRDACVVQKNDRCNFNLHRGRKCLRREPSLRWYHDEETGACGTFEYEGCGGNTNNYRKEWMCMKRCKSDLMVKLIIRIADETYFITIPKWLMMLENMNIQKTNVVSPQRFEFLQTYLEDLTSIRPPTPTATATTITEPATAPTLEWPEYGVRNMTRKRICALPTKVGPCKMYDPRWYFEPSDSKCHRFVFGGCAGNGNNFKTVMHCAEFCEAKVKPTKIEILQSELGIFIKTDDPPTDDESEGETWEGVERSLPVVPPVPPSTEVSGGETDNSSTEDNKNTTKKVSETEFELYFD